MSLTAERNEQFAEREYWEQRYADESEQEFDWFKNYDDLKELFDELIPRSARILMLGCGNSTLSPQMYAAGYTNIVNIDYSTTLIARLTSRYPDQTHLVQDITTLHHPASLTTLGGPASFDIALDKGTMDALMAEGKGSSVWNPSEKVVQDVREMLRGVDTVLKPGGKLVYVTFGQPHFRKRWLDEVEGWSVETRTLGDMFHYFVYVATKA
ncbi:related to SEE1-probable lysine methyltransferase [Sporisorium reilianum f. sp. reilianum]|uniref:Related to SEE1-probable lysine methyltransferase n=1 Tax=Sporisorium reilianum f. sp. reilianum TaxID=72559 RepID=A0A2N8UJ80_9BASI|nr:related to SEE1-probable lysine methyltransferase [Sporisorium reilianum f. sp. reilianum]